MKKILLIAIVATFLACKKDPSVIDKKEQLTEVKVAENEKVNRQKVLKTAQNEFNENTTSVGKNSEREKEKKDPKTNGMQTSGSAKVTKKQVPERSPSNGEIDNRIYTTVNQKAVPLVGFEKWGNEFATEFSAPNNIPANVKEIVLNLMFVVETDGTVSEVRVLGDKYGLAKEVDRTLKTISKWKPAVQNGAKVRYRFRQSIRIRIN